MILFAVGLFLVALWLTYSLRLVIFEVLDGEMRPQISPGRGRGEPAPDTDNRRGHPHHCQVIAFPNRRTLEEQRP